MGTVVNLKPNRTPKMPPRARREIEDDHYHPERLLRAAVECIAVSVGILALIVFVRHVFA